jgi:glyoxylase I family protein
VEITVDHPDAAAGADERRQRAHADLARWIAGDRADNNPFRPASHA